MDYYNYKQLKNISEEYIFTAFRLYVAWEKLDLRLIKLNQHSPKEQIYQQLGNLGNKEHKWDVSQGSVISFFSKWGSLWVSG